MKFVEIKQVKSEELIILSDRMPYPAIGSLSRHLAREGNGNQNSDQR